MLKKINIKNLAIIDDLTFDFQRGLNVLTGESGAGKSIIIKSIKYLLGNKIIKEDIRDLERDVVIEIVLMDGSIFKYLRTIAGKTTYYINGKVISRADTIDKLKNYFVLYSQHDQHQLLNSKLHIDFLDEYSQNRSTYDNYISLFHEYDKMNKSILAMKDNLDKLKSNSDLYEYQKKELDSFNFKEGDDEKYEDMYKVISESKGIIESMYSISKTLLGDHGISDILSKINQNLRKYSEANEDVEIIRERIEKINIEMNDLAFESDNLINSIQSELENSEDLERKILNIRSFKKQYGGTIRSVLDYKHFLENFSDNIESLNYDIENLDNDIIEKEKQLKSVAKELSSIRHNKSLELIRDINNISKKLNLEEFKFDIKFIENRLLSINGCETCEFFIKTNRGEQFKPLKDVISGGELSRIMMAMKLILSSSTRNKVYVFDEIDAGLSGESAISIANLLKNISLTNQLLCVSHLPQIVAQADKFFHVYKENIDSRTVSRYHILTGKDKIKYISKMISGEQVTPESIKYATTMIND